MKAFVAGLCFCLITSGGILLAQNQTLDRNIYVETVVDAPVPRVFEAFTTEKGLESFFAPECHIDLRVGGLLNIYFFPEAPPGQRGAENMRILNVQQNKMLGFTWNSPNDLPQIRNQWTHVTLKFFPDGDKGDRTRLVLIHDGWGDGEIWDQAFQYFVRAWKDRILFRLNYRFDHGPVNWNRPPVNHEQYNIIMQ